MGRLLDWLLRRTRPQRTLQWAVSAFGPVTLLRAERAARLVEEALEVAQAEGVPLPITVCLVERVYKRPKGELRQEVGGVALALEALAANAGLSVEREVAREWRRVRSLSLIHFQRKHAAKVRDGVAEFDS